MRSAVRIVSHIFRQILTLLIVVQLGRTYLMPMAHGDNLICNPSGQTPSAAEIKDIKALYAAAGKTLPKDVMPAGHCEKCLTPALAILSNNKAAGEVIHFVASYHFSPLSIRLYYSPQGPPLGGRAPPHIV